jgi:hypothetical protein
MHFAGHSPGGSKWSGEVRGHTIQPLVNSHRTTVPEGYLADARTIVDRTETPGEDDQLSEIVEVRERFRRRGGVIGPRTIILPGCQRPRREIMRRAAALRARLHNSRFAERTAVEHSENRVDGRCRSRGS